MSQSQILERPASAAKPGPRVAPPGKFKVIMHNDDTTPMDVVVVILVEVFKQSLEAATALMLQIHHQGKGIAGSYGSYELAEAKVARARDFCLQLSERLEHPCPLRMTIEKE